MGETAVSHHNDDMPPGGTRVRGRRLPRRPQPAACGRPAAADGPGCLWRPRLSDGVGVPSGNALNRSLRRYVLASSLRVWWIRHGLEAPDGTGQGSGVRPRGRCRGVVRPAGRRASGSCSGAGVRAGNRLSRYQPYRNGQIVHSAQAAVGVRGGVRCGANVMPPEPGDALDLVLATSGSGMAMQSNIFRFVMT
jgi:hypothetical protein